MNGDISAIPIIAFKKPTKPELTAFLKIRHPAGSKIPGKGNKGKLEDTQNGENNLIRLAFESRNLPLLTPLPETDDNGDLLLLPNDGSNDLSGKFPQGFIVA